MASPRSALRRDTRQTRDRLLDAVGELLAESGPTFGLPEVGRRGEVATATAYRHFETVHDAYHQYLLRTVDQLTAALSSVARSRTARGQFDGACRKWAEQALDWGPAIVHIRNWRGFLQRLHDHDPAIIALYAALEPIVLALVKDKVVPGQDIEYAILIWITMFDERVILDLGEAKGWPSRRIAKQLGSSVLHALGGKQAPLPRTRACSVSAPRFPGVGGERPWAASPRAQLLVPGCPGFDPTARLLGGTTCWPQPAGRAPRG